MQTSQDIQDLCAALVVAQGELENAVKDKANPHFKSKYADLTACLDVVRPCFARHGLAVVQAIEEYDAGRIKVTSRIVHKSGQWMESTAVIPLTKQDAQGLGSAATYGRRYSLAAMTGLGQEDDDGNAASQRAKPKATSDLRARFEAAKTSADIDALAKEFVKLSLEEQAALKPIAQAARTRCGL